MSTVQEPQLSKESDRALRTLNKHRQTIESDIASITTELASENVDAELISELVDEVLSSVKEFRLEERKNYDADFPDKFNFGFDLLKKVKNLKLQVNKLIKVPETTNNNSMTSAQVKLPDIALPSFSGEFREWFSFRDAFNSLIGNNSNLSNLEKFQYLKSSLKGEAARTIQSLELTEVNYANALQLLCENFENKRLIVNSHLQEIFNLPQIKKESTNDYREFINTISQNTSALESLGRPVNSSEDWLLYLILLRCPNSIKLEWENQLSNSEMPTVNDLTKFLSKRLRSLETVNNTSGSSTDNLKLNTTNKSNNNSLSCYMCSQPHQLFMCNKFRTLDVTKRLDLVHSKKLCKNCLKVGHNVIDCKSTRRCKTCDRSHNSLLHFNNKIQLNPSSSSNCVNNSENGTVLLATSLVEIRAGDKQHTVRALLDPGSQVNLISISAIKRINLKTSKTNQTLSVAGASKFMSQNYVDIQLTSQINDFTTKIRCFSIDKITNKLPSERVNVKQIEFPNHIQLADPLFYNPADIDLLIGVELYNSLLKPERMIVNENNLTLQNTQLGWIISGKVPDAQPQKRLSCYSVTLTQLNSNIKRFWEVENVETNVQFKSKEEIQCEEFFNSTVDRDLDGRFVVALPWKTDTSALGNSYGSARKRFFNLEHKLRRNPALNKEYIAFMREYINLGHMTRVPYFENVGYFLPHHAVIKNSSLTTKLRVVFDASAKSQTKISLNDLLLTGPTLQDDLFDILIRFRIHEYVITADVQMMFRQIKVRESDRKYQQILWRESCDQPIHTYQLNTVTYGTRCAPYLAVRCLRELAKDAPDSLTSQVILRDFYMDDVLTGASTIKEARRLRDSLGRTLAKGGFLLRKWASNNANIVSDLNNSETNNHVLNLTLGDASLAAYGSVIYLKSFSPNGSASCKLFCAKSRVAPLKTITLPRLELCAAVLTANLVDRVKNALHEASIKCFYYSDSTIVLSWLNSEPCKFKQFVAHRIGEIQRLSDTSNWYHIRSEQNPADIISRGSLPSELKNNQLWWHGPEFLIHGPIPQIFVPRFDKNAEFRTLIVTQTDPKPHIPWINNYSNFTKLLRVTAWVNRFIHNITNSNAKIRGELNVDELNRAEILIIRATQLTTFDKEFNQIKANQPVDTIMQLSPFIDQAGIIRVGGRLRYAKLMYDSKFPIILPRNNKITHLIIRHYHNKNLHVGPQGTLAAVRTKYWPISGKNTVKRIIRECVVCFRTNPRSSQPIMGHLPECRSEQLRPFIKTGIDYGGPFLIKEGQRKTAKCIKTYIALFVCMSTKAVHIEIVRDLTTESFLAALRRFISRRGMVTDLYSDNATTFVGANSELKRLHTFLKEEQDELKATLSIDRVNWHFIPPRAPHFGGLWEAGIKSTKRILYKIAGGANLMYDEFFTLLTQIESILNSRPLCPLSNDPNDLTFLTPGHFLIGGNLRALPEPNLDHIQIGRLSRWQLVQRMQQHFWARWQKEYLQELQGRRKWKQSSGQPLEVGQLVLVHEDNVPPCRWRVGRVEIVHPGADGVVRAATVKTTSDSVLRPAVKLYSFPINIDNQPQLA